MKDIPAYDTFETIYQINKGWSGEGKYYIKTNTNETYLLRMTDAEKLTSKQEEFAYMKQLANKGLSISEPLEIGLCNDGKSTYTLYTWCDGKDAAEVLPNLTENEQYTLGIASGEILEQIHSLEAPEYQEDWEVRFNRKTTNKIKAYEDCGESLAGGRLAIEYIEANRDLLKDRPQTFHHGDYHVGNMVISDKQQLSVIDFNRFDFGDPWEEFNRIVWSASASPSFASGQLNGYFGGQPPEKFFQLLLFYISSNMLSSITWAMTFGEKEMETMREQSNEILEWYDQYQRVIPSWYMEK